MRLLGLLDPRLTLVTVVLVSLGLLMIYSASTHVALRSGEAADNFLTAQAGWVAFGLVFFILGLTVPPDLLFLARTALLGILLVALVLVYVPGIGVSVNGSSRWLGLPGLPRVQPSEFVKVAMIIFIAGMVRARGDKPLRGVRDLTKTEALMLAAPIPLIGMEKDVGTAINITLIVLVMLLLAGFSWREVLGGAGLFAGAVAVAVSTKSHGSGRIQAWLDPWNDVGGIGYHITRSFRAFAEGGVFGKGFGNSLQKLYNNLPEPHTDSILAVWGEELGLVGTCAAVALFLLYFHRALTLAGRARDPFLALLGYGVGFAVVCQALVNMLVITGAIPMTGIPLPFLSYGGTSVVTMLFATGLLMNVGWRARLGREG